MTPLKLVSSYKQFGEFNCLSFQDLSSIRPLKIKAADSSKTSISVSNLLENVSQQTWIFIYNDKSLKSSNVKEYLEWQNGRVQNEIGRNVKYVEYEAVDCSQGRVQLFGTRRAIVTQALDAKFWGRVVGNLRFRKKLQP